MKQVIVVGGGAAGLMAAIQAAREGAVVTVLEKQKKPGMKLLRTGNGRCNFTNTGCAKGKYHGTDPEFALKVLAGWTAEDTISFFSDLGVLPYRNGDWIYPHSEQAQSVLHALLFECERLHIRFKNQEQVVSVRKKDNLFQVWTRNWKYLADSVILCCGTNASQKKEFQTGASRICPGISFRPLHPALCPLISSLPDRNLWAGTRAHARAALYSDHQKIQEESGQIQFTPEGISGIAVMNMASSTYESLRQKKKTEIVLDLVPELKEDELRQYLQIHGCRTDGIIPEKLSRIISDRETGASKTAHRIKSFAIDIRGLGSAEQSQVLGGGFLTSQFDPKTMMCQSEPGLYAAGETLDIDGECGGWNLQFAWATGAIAGKAAARKTV